MLQAGYQANPLDPPPVADRRGQHKQLATRYLLDRLARDQDALLALLDNFAVPPDLSLAERDISKASVQQEVSDGFRSLIGAGAFCPSRGYLSTLLKQRMTMLTALEQALVGHPVSPAF